MRRVPHLSHITWNVGCGVVYCWRWTTTFRRQNNSVFIVERFGQSQKGYIARLEETVPRRGGGRISDLWPLPPPHIIFYGYNWSRIFFGKEGHVDHCVRPQIWFNIKCFTLFLTEIKLRERKIGTRLRCEGKPSAFCVLQCNLYSSWNHFPPHARGKQAGSRYASLYLLGSEIDRTANKWQ